MKHPAKTNAFWSRSIVFMKKWCVLKKTGLWKLANLLLNLSCSEGPKLLICWWGVVTLKFSHGHSLGLSQDANSGNRKVDCRWKCLQPQHSCNIMKNPQSHHARLYHKKVITLKMDLKKKVKNRKILWSRQSWSKNIFFVHLPGSLLPGPGLSAEDIVEVSTAGLLPSGRFQPSAAAMNYLHLWSGQMLYWTFTMRQVLLDFGEQKMK